ncbi:MAG TPA: hypothetical protein VMD78_15970 [Candidatus Baltobacteraceae bacterium]|nr:hypothetical protein [Candidatus Baltobacteraceae bacterium]
MSTKLLAGTAILCLLATAPLYAQPNQDNNQHETAPAAPDKGDKAPEKPAKQPSSKPMDKQPKPTENRPKTEAPRQQNDQQQQKADEKAQQNEQKNQQKQAKEQQKQEEKATKQATKDQHDQNRGRAPVESADNGRRIPEDRYRADFGREHTFHVHRDHDRFQFGGFWFQFTDAWPSDWTDGDNFYVIEDGGVDYLCDSRFPDQRIVVVVVS